MRIISYCLIILVLASCQSKEKIIEPKDKVEISIEKLDSPVENSLRGISVLSDEIAWLSGAKGNVVKTEDGGSSWQKLSLPDKDSLDFRSLHAFSESAAIVASSGFPSRIFKTIDSGESWNLVYENKDSAAFMNSIAFRNKNEGIVFGDVLDGSHLILKTIDGGNTWNRVAAENMPEPLSIENGFAASGSCIAIDNQGKYYIALGGEKVRVFSSSNGEIWKATETPMYSGSGSKGAYSIAFGDETLIAVGGDYLEVDSARYPVIFKDGIGWAETEGAVLGYRSVIDYCEKENIWLSAGTNGIDITYDSGITWSKISEENTNTLRFAPNSSIAFIGNSKGEISLIDVSWKLKKD